MLPKGSMPFHWTINCHIGKRRSKDPWEVHTRVENSFFTLLYHHSKDISNSWKILIHTFIHRTDCHSSYPMLPPTVRFLTKIFHPNVSRHGDVGIDIIQHNWLLSLTISKILLSVQSLLTDPFTEASVFKFDYNNATFDCHI